jgi:hypothetical protein
MEPDGCSAGCAALQRGENHNPAPNVKGPNARAKDRIFPQIEGISIWMFLVNISLMIIWPSFGMVLKRLKLPFTGQLAAGSSRSIFQR